jgi:hypothetical protein
MHTSEAQVMLKRSNVRPSSPPGNPPRDQIFM